MLIEKLTEEQEILLQSTVAEALANGRSCAPIQMERAVPILEEFYSRMGKNPPNVLKFDSPMSCILAYGVLKEQPNTVRRGQLQDQLGGQLRDQLQDQLGDQLGDKLRGQLGGQLWGQLGNQLWGQLRDQLQDQLGDQLRGQLWGQLQDQLGGQLGGQLQDQLQDQLWGQLGGQLGGQLENQLRNYFGGNHFGYWKVYYDFARKIGVNYEGQNLLLNLWMSENSELHWWFPYAGVVLVSERPVELYLDGQGRMHHSSKMACRYKDGWGAYRWHGIKIPEAYYEAPCTPPQILAEPNAEVRRALMERYDDLNGKGKFMLDAGAKVLDSAIQHTPGFVGEVLNELISLDLPDDDPEGRMLAVRMVDPSTLREYLLRVHPELRPMLNDGTFGKPQKLTVLNALASTHGLRGEQYVLSQES